MMACKLHATDNITIDQYKGLLLFKMYYLIEYLSPFQIGLNAAHLTMNWWKLRTAKRVPI